MVRFGALIRPISTTPLARARIPMSLSRYSFAAGVALMLTQPAARADEIPEKYQPTVRKGLEYLAKHQFKDGHWGANGGQYPVSMTALAGMAMLMEGSTIREGKYSTQHPHGRRLAHGPQHEGQQPQRPDRQPRPSRPRPAATCTATASALLFLACVYGEEEDQRAPREAEGHPDARRQVHRQRPIDAGRLGLHLRRRTATTSTKAR